MDSKPKKKNDFKSKEFYANCILQEAYDLADAKVRSILNLVKLVEAHRTAPAQKRKKSDKQQNQIQTDKQD